MRSPLFCWAVLWAPLMLPSLAHPVSDTTASMTTAPLVSVALM
jgi:hypothetical protein